jgi:hypothetical protein
VIGPSVVADSVDGDDGVIDGLDRDGRSWAEVNNLASEDGGYTFTFTPLTLGRLPTQAGIVWTDGMAPTQFEACGPGNVLIGMMGPFSLADGTLTGETAEDRFLGIRHDPGIAATVIRSPGGVNNLEVDHLHYGVIVPEPSTFLLLGAGIAVLLLGAAGEFCARDHRGQH